MKRNKIKVLLIDDSHLYQSATIKILRKLDALIDLAKCGKDAIQLFKKNNYHIVFMDIALLDMDGFTIAENLRELEKQKKQNVKIPIIAISAYDETSFKKRAKSVGINDYFIKPLTFSGYKEILKRYLPHRDWGKD